MEAHKVGALSTWKRGSFLVMNKVKRTKLQSQGITLSCEQQFFGISLAEFILLIAFRDPTTVANIFILPTPRSPLTL